MLQDKERPVSQAMLARLLIPRGELAAFLLILQGRVKYKFSKAFLVIIL